MAWTTPTSAPFLAGHDPTSAELIEQITNNFKAIGDAWTTYTPTWTSSSNPSIGNGTLLGAYIAAGKFVTFRITIIMGSTTTYGSGAYSFGLPVASATTDNSVAQGAVRDASPASIRQRLGYANTTTTVALQDDAGVHVSATVPFTLASTDTIRITGTYEAA